ncbi:MAG: hypothetical protein AABX61_03320, partial [Nanoarchaeota archaeon]
EAVRKVLTDYKGTRAALDTFNVGAQGPVKGSNIYSRFALANAYREISKENIRPINPRESEIALANDALTDQTSTYEDLGLAVYSKEGSNPKLWKNLREQVKSNFANVNLSKPFVITGLMKVVKDSNYEDGLKLDADELTEVYNVPILNKKTGSFDTKDPQLQKTGFPSKLGKGNRTLYTSDNGVQGFFRNGNLVLDARYDNLADSNDDGRVHFVKNFSSGNLEELVAKLEQERIKEQETLDKRFEKAKKVLLNQ